jgi:YesN/AraC family two-component response regulator
MEEFAAKNILLVDDHRNFLTILAEELKGYGNNFCILTAENGDRALKVLESAQVDLVVTDIRMPVMDGFALISHMKEKYPTIPVIVVSSFLYSEWETELKAMGVTKYMEKCSLSVSALEDMILLALPLSPEERRRAEGG